MIVIVTDSTAYLTKQEAKTLGVLYIPMTYTVDGKTSTESFVDMFQEAGKEDIGSLEMTTSQPGMGLILHRFAKLRASNCEVLCLTISSRLSGTYSNARVCARDLGDKGIRVVDTQESAAGLAFMVKEARRLIDGGMSLNDTADALLAMRERVQTFFSVKDLTPLRKSGRLGFVRQSIGTILNQRPILACKDGAVVCCDVARGTNEQVRKLVALVPEGASDVTVQCFVKSEISERVAQLLEKKCDQLVPVRGIGPVLGVHLGFDVIGILWVDPV